MKSRKTYTVKEATAKLMRFCTYRERCHKEVKAKLYKLNMIPEAQDQIITTLIREGFLNEQRFAKAFVKDKFNLQKWGKQRIKQALKYRHISPRLIAKALEEIDDEVYHKTFIQLSEKKRRTLTDTNVLKKKQKLAGYLLRKGYSSTLVYDHLQEVDLEK